MKITNCPICGKLLRESKSYDEVACSDPQCRFNDSHSNYHNPADVELLRKARKALHKGISELKVHCKPFDQTPEEDACIEMHEAVVEIDRAIGGEESEGKER